MSSNRAVFALPETLRPGDKVPCGRGPWAVVERVVPALGRPPRDGRQVVIQTKGGRRSRKVPADLPLRVMRVAPVLVALVA